MKRATIDDLCAETVDILVIGGGIYGMMATREAALRGLRVALVESGDFGGGTSHNSLKVMHGGIRYVQHLDFGRLRASVRERAFWQAAAAPLVRPMDFVIPLFGWGVRGPGAFAAAAALYTAAAVGLRGPGYGGAGVVSPRVARNRLGELAPDGLTGGGVWRDGQITDINRLHLGVLRAATDAGALAANHVEAAELTRSGNRITGARLRDRLSGAEGHLSARLVLCCCGAATPALVERAIPGAAAGFPGFARATNLVIDRPAPPVARAFVSRSRADAVVDRGGRMYFVTPWNGLSIIGTHEAPSPDAAPRDPADLSDFVRAVQSAAPGLNLSDKDILWAHQGLIPADTDDGRGSTVHRLTRGTMIDHAEAQGVGGLISVVGVKYTTARLIASRAVTRAALRLGKPCHDPEVSVRSPLPVSRQDPLDETAPDSLTRRMTEAFEDEMAMTLADAAIRRTDLAERGRLSDPALVERLAEAAARSQGWSEQRRTAERDGLLAELGAASGRPGPISP